VNPRRTLIHHCHYRQWGAGGETCSDQAQLGTPRERRGLASARIGVKRRFEPTRAWFSAQLVEAALSTFATAEAPSW
jgi:hypothetical protein